MKSIYPKNILHHGFEVNKLGTGIYQYRGFTLVSDVVYGGFEFLNDKPKDCLFNYSSLVMACRAIDESFARPIIPTLPIDIVTINYKSV